MKLTITIVLACLGALSCSDEQTITAPPAACFVACGTPSSDNSSGELSVTLTVTGDPAAGYADYPVYSDQVEIGRIKPGETVKFRLDGYSHIIELGPKAPAIFGVLERLLSWCELTTSDRFSVHPTSSHPVSISFGLNCPPLDGEGEIKIKFAVGSGAPDSEIVVDLYRMGATPNHVSLTAAANTNPSVRLSPGVYSVDANGSNCQLSYVVWLEGVNLVIVRKDSTSSYTVNLDCT